MENHLNLSPEEYTALREFHQSIENFRMACIKSMPKFSHDTSNLLNKVQATLKCAQADIRMVIKSIEDEKAQTNK